MPAKKKPSLVLHTPDAETEQVIRAAISELYADIIADALCAEELSEEECRRVIAELLRQHRTINS